MVREQGDTPPPKKKIRKKYFAGNYYVKLGHFDNFSSVFFRQKCRAPLKLTELYTPMCTTQKQQDFLTLMDISSQVSSRSQALNRLPSAQTDG